MIRVGVFGAGGRMGREVCRAVDADPDLRLAAAVDPAFAGRDVSSLAGIDPAGGTRVVIADDAEALLDAEVDVAVDFTVPTSVVENVRWCVRHAMHVVVGTTGLGQEHLALIESLIEEEGRESNVFVAPNFAIGAVLMMRFAEMAAAWFPDAEIIELHHAVKRDAPSGTSLATLDKIVSGRRSSGGGTAPQEVVETLPGARGAERDGVRVHSVRLPGLVAHQEVIFGATGQTLTIRHDSMDRTSFMPGVVLAVKEVSKHPGLTVGLERLLGLG
ncbi:MAG: 4-hydroxy-tetrahydrodipicolinate reductase [Actinomycetota bacterium]